MTAPLDAWPALLKRLGRSDKKDPYNEWFMPLEDKWGRLAWSKWAEPLDGRYVGTKGQEGVAWNFPIVPRMRRALALAEAQLKDDPKNPLLGRVARDLRSYREHGCSSTSPDHPKRKALGLDDERPKKRLAAKGRAALARKKPAP
jgi:hypothetical protein